MTVRAKAKLPVYVYLVTRDKWGEHQSCKRMVYRSESRARNLCARMNRLYDRGDIDDHYSYERVEIL